MLKLCLQFLIFIFEYELAFLTEILINIYFKFIEAGLFVSSSQIVSVINLLPDEASEEELDEAANDLLVILKHAREKELAKVIEFADSNTLEKLFKSIFLIAEDKFEYYPKDRTADMTFLLKPILEKRDEIQKVLGYHFYRMWMKILLITWNQRLLIWNNLLDELENASI